MAYRPILEPSQLPPTGPLSEDLRFDMKLVVAQHKDVGDLATDVAAFANTAGGVLLIGAHEHPKDSGILHAYRPLSHVDAQGVGASLKQALRLCSPKPIAEAKQLSYGNGFIVAINCDAYAAPPIGVAQVGQAGGEKWWAFPTRRGRDSHNLRPEELATIMEPRLRRFSLLLDRIPTNQPDGLRHAKFHSTNGMVHSLAILSIDPDASSVNLIDLQDRREVFIPLDAVRMIWREPEQPIFNVALSGRIERTYTAFVFLPAEKVN